MLILLSPGVLVGTACALFILRFARPGFRFGWLWALGAAALGWMSIWLWPTQAGPSVVLPMWPRAEFLSDAPTFLADGYSKLYGLSLVGVLLAFLLMSSPTRSLSNPSAWVFSLASTGLALLAVTADNAVSLALVWAALDLADLIAMIRRADRSQSGELAAAIFSMRAAGIGLLLLAQVVSSQPARSVPFSVMLPAAGVLLLAAAAIRLAALAIRLPYDSEPSWARGGGAVLRLASAAASLVLLSRVPPLGLSSLASSLLLLVCAIVALQAGWLWIRAADDVVGRPYWIVVIAVLSLASALRGQAVGAAAWGSALILAGGILFLSSIRQRWLNRSVLVGAWTLSALPLSLTASVWKTDLGRIDLLLPAFVVAQSLLLAGYVRHASPLSIQESLETQPAWVRRAYPAGILLLAALQVVLGLVGWQGSLQVGFWPAGLVASLAALGLSWSGSRFPLVSRPSTHQLPSAITWTLHRLEDLIRRIYAAMRTIANTIAAVIEGQAGIMWSLLLLVLFISLIVGGSR